MELEVQQRSRCSGFFQEQVVQRGVNAGIISLHILTSIGELAHGGCLLIKNVLVLGSSKSNFDQAFQLLYHGLVVLARIFYNVLRVINPNNPPPDQKFSLSYSRSPMVGFSSDFTVLFNQRVLARKTTCQAHVTNRLMALGALIKIFFLRVIDTMICLFAVPAAILTLGKIEKVNSVAYSTLHFPFVLADIFFFAMKVINPWAGIQQDVNHGIEEEVRTENND